MNTNTNAGNSNQANPTTPGMGGSNQGRGYRGNRSAGRGRRNVDRGYRSNSAFKGETACLSGHVFQLQEESRDPTQFKETMETIERYVNKTYNVDMRVLFNTSDIKMPSVSRPEKPDKDEE